MDSFVAPLRHSATLVWRSFYLKTI